MNGKGGIFTPYYRIYRKNHCGNDEYVLDNRYADDADLLYRAYQMLEQDLREFFQYVEPSDEHEKVFSLRAYGLLLRAATEFETNCKRILAKNCR